MTAGPLLEVRALSAEIRTGTGRTPARVLDSIDLRVGRGETFALLGESGCGKSMTALALMRLLPASGRIVSGQVVLGGTDLLRIPEGDMRRVRGGRMAMIFQEPQTALNPVRSIGAQIAEAVRVHAESPDERRPGSVRERVLDLLDSVGIPDPPRRIDEYPHQLSGGMKQRATIAMALAGRPELLIADEPTTALDVTVQAQVLRLLKDLQGATGMAVLLITHDLGVAAETADRLAVMYAGRIVEAAPIDAFFAGPAHPYSRRLLASQPDASRRGERLAAIPGRVPVPGRMPVGCRFAPRCHLALPICAETEPDWTRLGPGRGVRCHLGPPSAVAPTPPPLEAMADPPPVAVAAVGSAQPDLLRIEGLKVHFPIRRGLLRRTVGQVKAVDGLSLGLATGRTLALVGESGCGKTTAVKGLLGLVVPTGGSVRYLGQELAGLSGRRMRPFRKDLQIVFQDPYSSLDPRMLVGESVAEGLKSLRLRSNAQARARRAVELLDLVGLDAETMDRYPHELSGGQRQRVCIARALAVEPRVLVCDEPTSALDVSVQAQILNLLKDLQDRLGLAYLFVTHNISAVAYLAQEVAVMYLGRIVECGPTDRVLGDPRHPYTRALLSAVPVPDPRGRREAIRLEGDIPSPATPPPGCHFHPRCPQAGPECALDYPPEMRLDGGRVVRCLRVS